MGVLREIPPTAGLPVSAKDISSLFNIRGYSGLLEKDFKKYLGVDCARITYSGTAAFYLILESIKKLSFKRTVVIPSYVCPLVPLAIKRAGLKVEVCDIQRDNFNFNEGELQKLCFENGDILAVLAVHLVGIPIDIDPIVMLARQRGIFVIEDCAQSLGAEYKGRRTGTFGDFSFFSLCRGKGLTIFEGGVAVTAKEGFSAMLEGKARDLFREDPGSEGLKILELLGYALFYRPRLFWFVYRLPEAFWEALGRHLKAGGEYYTEDFDIHNVSNTRKMIGHAGFSRLDEEIAGQRERAAFFIENLKRIKGIKAISEAADSRATYPFLMLLLDDPEKKRRALNIFKRSGLGLSDLYSFSITDYDYLKDIVPRRECPNATHLAERQITISTNRFLKRRDMDAILKIIEGL